ncbi:BspA family leucine-rich repeat surface protein [Enterococcus gallinarum]|uniref:BspA family leucine-rich repeat surface protein n=1 Tax=Enterococcus gallinarum TaxID=1353 RepID=UPI00321BAEE1
MKKKSWLIMLILIFYIFQPIMALSEDYTQKEEAAQELPENEEPDTLDSHESVSEEEDSMEEATWDTEIDSTPEESWQQDETPDESFTDNDRQESEEQDENPQSVDQRSEIQGSWGTVPWTYDEETNTMTLYGGDGGTTLNAPWRAYRPRLEQIIVAGRVRLPSDSSNLFASTPNLQSIQNEHNFDTSQVTNMTAMFSSTSSLKRLDLSTWDTRSVTDMRSLVYNSGIESLNVSGFDTSAVTNLRSMFAGATNLKELTLGEKSIFYMSDDFWSVASLPDVPITERYTGRWVLRESIEWEADLIAYDTSYEFLRNYDGSYPGTYIWEEKERALWGTVPWEYDESSKTITLFGGTAGIVANAPWKNLLNEVELIIVTEKVTLPENSGQLFMGLSHLREIQGIDKFDTSSVIYMNWMFGSNSSLTSLDLNQWDTTSVINMHSMFSGASSLTDLAIGNIDTSRVITMASMFVGTTSLETLDIQNWNTRMVENMSSMFARSGIVHLDLNNWNTTSLTNINGMFQNAANLKTVNMKDWQTSRIVNMTSTFQNASAISELNLSGWTTNTLPVTITNMFGGMTGLRSLTLGERSIFNQSVGLPSVPVNHEYTGRWILSDPTEDTDPIAFSSSAEFMNNYNGSHPGTYIWEPNTLKELSAGLHPVSDQSDSITGYMTESVDVLSITYQNTDGSTVVIEKDSPRIEWGDYQDPQQQIRSFKIVLAENERLETTTKVILFLSKPSVNTLEDITIDREVIKGIEYRANNITLDRLAINDLASNAELHQMILRESRASAKNLLTEADLSSEIRVIETDLTLDTTIDGTYYARLEVGNKAYQFWIGIDVSSKLGHLKVTIPTKMIFESLYDDAESNRSFESADYEIQNQSRIPVDTYVTQLAITDDAGITLLAEGESPLDYVTPIHQDQASESGIPIPLLRLSIKTEEAEVQLSERMAEQHFVRLSQRSHVPVKLSGHYYGPYPRWITDDQMQQGGYYEESLAPKYQIILRFVP